MRKLWRFGILKRDSLVRYRSQLRDGQLWIGPEKKKKKLKNMKTFEGENGIFFYN